MRKSTSKVPAPGYTTDKPRFPALTRLNAELGFQDAALQVTELAIRVLGEQASMDARGTPRYLREAFAKRAIPQGTHDLTEAQRVIHQAEVVQTYAVVDSVLRQLAREYRLHKWISWSWSTESGDVLPPLAALIAHLPSTGGKRLRAAPESELTEYYRLLRVSVVHKSKETTSAVQSAWKALSNRKGYFTSTYGLDAPNPPTAITFDDFQLFTRSIKFFANLLNEVCDLTLKEIRDFLVLKDREVLTELAVLPKVKQLGALRAHAHGRYQLSTEQASNLSQSDLLQLRERISVTFALNEHNAGTKRQLRPETLRDGRFRFTAIVKKDAKDGSPPEEFGPFSTSEALTFLQSAGSSRKSRR